MCKDADEKCQRMDLHLAPRLVNESGMNERGKEKQDGRRRQYKWK